MENKVFYMIVGKMKLKVQGCNVVISWIKVKNIIWCIQEEMGGEYAWRISVVSMHNILYFHNKNYEVFYG